MVTRRSTPAYRVASAIPGRIRLEIVDRRVAVARLLDLAAGARAFGCEPEVVLAARSVTLRFSSAAGVLPLVRSRIEGLAEDLLVPAATCPCEGAPRRTVRPAASGAAARHEPMRGAQAEARFAVRHSIPGRLRVEARHLRGRADVAAHIGHHLSSESGIAGIEANGGNGNLIIRYDPRLRRPGGIVRRIEQLLVGALNSPAPKVDLKRACELPAGGETSPLRLLAPATAVALAAAGAAPILAAAALAVASIPVATDSLKGVWKRRCNVAQLDLASIVVLALLGDFVTGAVMTVLIGIGDLIQARTRSRSRRAISELMAPSSQQAWVRRSGTLVAVPVSDLAAGDVVYVYPGDSVPVDGAVVSGRALLDQKLLTGEPEPVVKLPGDTVFALTIVVDGDLAVQVEHIGSETRAGRVAQMIESAPLSDTRVSNYAALVGDRLAAPLFVLAGAMFLITGDAMRAASVMILDFVTGIRVSAPTTILSAMTSAARHGLFIKGGKAMERLAMVDAIVLDKTGTLTTGQPHVVAVESVVDDSTAEGVLQLAASAEASLKHPAACALVRAAAERGLATSRACGIRYTLGAGVEALVDGCTVHVGSLRYLLSQGIDGGASSACAEHHDAAGRSIVYVARACHVIGVIAYEDPIRPEAASVIHALRERGIRRIVMLTGDHARAARLAAEPLGITDIVADAFPDQKAETIRTLKAAGYTVAFLGDGINDSAGFAYADVGISMQTGADVAKETADVVLLDPDLCGLPRAIDLARSAMRLLRQNVNIVVVPTSAALAGCVAGLVGPLAATVVNNGVSVVAGVNALRPLVSCGSLSWQPASEAVVRSSSAG